MVGVFAATDVFLFYVFFEAMLVPMYFIIGSFGGPRRQYAAVKFFLYSLVGGLIMLAAVIGLYVVSNSQLGEGTFAFDALRAAGHRPGRAEAAVPRLLHRLRHQGAAGAVPHLAARLRFRGADRRRGAAGRRPGQGRHVRLPALLPAAVPGRLAVLRAVRPRARGGRHPLRGAAGDGAERHEAAGVLHVDLALRLHRAGHLRLHHRRPPPARCSTWSTTASRPACCSSSSACSSPAAGRGRSATTAASRPQAPLLGGVFLVAGLASLALPGTNSFVSEFLVLIGSFQTRPVFTIIATVGIILAALYMLLMYQRTMHGPAAGRAAAGGRRPSPSAAAGGRHRGRSPRRRRHAAGPRPRPA